MKNLITIALLCLATSAYSQIEIHDTAIDATLTLGRYGADCSGRGTCSFQVNTTIETSNAKVVLIKTIP